MRNLELWKVDVRNHTTNSEDRLVTCCYGHGEGTFSGELYSCSHNLILSNFDNDGEIRWSKDLSEMASPENNPVNVTYLSLSNSLCVGLGNGELYTISQIGDSCELAGVCKTGLLAMEWSPDQELLVLITKDMNTMLMSCTFDPIHETNILDQEFGEQQFITVGWGKKETQFHGSEGKQAAKQKTEVTADPNGDTNGTVKISWRGDGNLYAIGFLMDGIRRFKVFDREGHLQYTSEKQPGLESNLSWRPSGNVIATTQKVNDKYVIAFFEKNGLKHGGFDIPVDSQTEVQDLAWSSDSEILALQCFNTVTNSHSILLFTTGNYHWYLKQTLILSSYQKISKMFWDNHFKVANNKKLHLVLTNGRLYSYSWIWNINHSRGKSQNDDAVVAVIDAKKVLVTGFRQTVLPPPMASFEIELETFVNSVHFAPDQDNEYDSNTFFVCTTEGKLVFYKQTSKFPLKYEVSKTVTLEKYNFPFHYYNWFWLNTDTIICTETNNNNNHFLIEYRIKSKEITKINTESVPGTVTRIQPHPTDNSVAYLQLLIGDIMEYNLGGAMIPQDVSFSVACPSFNVVLINDNIHFISLSHNGAFYLDDDKILNNVSSFFVHTHFILLTTLQHVLLCVELTQTGLNALKEYQKNESTDVYKRKIERGAKLVIAVPNDTRTVFQMPRGNLEGIQPRPLSLKIIGEYLDNCKYYEAFDLMRKQRINLNLIYDHDPEKFEKSMDIFLDTIQNNTWLSLFLSDLENADVTKSMYSSSYIDKKDTVKREPSSKIQRICETIRANLMNRSDKDMKILPILTTFVKINTVEDLESALNVIKDLKLQETAGSKLPIVSDEALKYLLYMVDVNHLFDVALGMYDFDLVLLVANKSQKDPKEYVPMLNEFNSMEENYKRFSINKHLKRFTRAVQCLAKCGHEKYDELRTFVKYHSLYREALRLFTRDDDIYKEIADDFGLHLKLKKQFTEAGIIYERANNIEKAIECYKDALEWELVVKLLCCKPKEEHSVLCWELANGLKDDKRYKEGLTLLEQFCDDKEDIVKYAIEGHQFITALRLCSQYQLSGVKDNQLLPALMEEYRNLQELIERNWSTFTKHRERLMIVRETKKNAPEIDVSYVNKDSDLYSDAGSTVASSASRSSGRTFRSSKNRRKHERKIASLKEGSQYEDVALVMALHNLITSSFELRLQAKEVNTVLSCFEKDHEAFLLQTCLEKLLKEMRDSFKDIWTNELVIEATNATIAALNVPEGSSVLPQGIASLEPHMRIAPTIQDISWKLELN